MAKPGLQIRETLNIFLLFYISNNPVVVLNQLCIDFYRFGDKILNGLIHRLSMGPHKYIIIRFSLVVGYSEHGRNAPQNTTDSAVAVHFTFSGFHDTEITFRINDLALYFEDP